MPSNFDSFDQSPLGSLIESPLGVRGFPQSSPGANGVYTTSGSGEYYAKIHSGSSPTSKKLTFSLWVHFEASSTPVAEYNTADVNGGTGEYENFKGFAVYIGSRFRLYETDTFTKRLDINLIPGQWNHILISADTALGNAYCYFNDQPIGVAFTPDFIMKDYSSEYTNWFFRKGCYASLYVNHNSAVDLSIVENRRKFISNNLAHVDLGSSGEKPLDTLPDTCFIAPNMVTNVGTLGEFTKYSGMNGPLPSCGF